MLVSPWSEDSDLSNSVVVTVSVGDGIVSLGESSDGSGSGIEGEPLVVAEGGVVLDSQSVLMSSDVFVP